MSVASNGKSLARSERPRALFICGSLNQTTQMHQIARQLPELDAYFTPFYCDGVMDRVRRLGLLDRTIAGWRWRKVCMRYLRRHGLAMDFEGRRRGHDYDLVVTCTDLFLPRAIRDRPLVVVQEGITDPQRFWYWARKVLPLVPRWAAGTAWTGTSNLYDRFCVASEGYRELFARRGADPEKMVVTGIPNFDDCARYRDNQFPHRGYLLVCTSDARETLKLDNRKAFILRAVALAAGRALIFKLHPNENLARARAEIARWAPGALVYDKGSAEEMVANADALMCQYSTLAFVGVALGKEVHSYYPPEELRRLLPLQRPMSAARIAEVCRGLLAERQSATVARRVVPAERLSTDVSA
jgi:hypothetical protein